MRKRVMMKRFSAVIIFVFLGLIGFSQDSAHYQTQDRTTGTTHKFNTQPKKKTPFKFVKNFFKYSTLYASGRVGQPLQESNKEWYVSQDSRLTDVTEVYPFDYTISVGIRKIARFDYEIKPNVFYDGSEENVGWKSNVGAVEGFEYLFAYDWVRQWGDEYRNQSYFLRYLGKHWVAAVKFNEFGVADLKYAQADARGRLAIGKHLNFTAGAVVRSHGPYGYNPIGIYLRDNPWWTLAYDAGYTDQFYQIVEYGGAEPDTTYDWSWQDPNGDDIASTDEEFRTHYYGDIVNDFQQEKLSEVGGLFTLSAVIGMDFYYYSDNERFWCHAWTNVMPVHKHIIGDERFSYGEFVSRNPATLGKTQWVDFNGGLMLGAKIGKGFGLFLEGDYLRYWDRQVYSGKVGVNYQFK
jgi:hypothetical protein